MLTLTHFLTIGAILFCLSVAGIILIPALIDCILDLLRKPADVLPGQHLAAAARCSARHFAQAAIVLERADRQDLPHNHNNRR